MINVQIQVVGTDRERTPRNARVTVFQLPGSVSCSLERPSLRPQEVAPYTASLSECTELRVMILSATVEKYYDGLCGRSDQRFTVVIRPGEETSATEAR